MWDATEGLRLLQKKVLSAVRRKSSKWQTFNITSQASHTAVSLNSMAPPSSKRCPFFHSEGRAGNDIIVAFFPCPFALCLTPPPSAAGNGHLVISAVSVWVFIRRDLCRGCSETFTVRPCGCERELVGKTALCGAAAINRASGNLFNNHSWDV